MKIYIITKVSFPYGLAATNRVKCLAKAFIEGGNDCKVIVFGRNSETETASPEGVFEGVPYQYLGGSSKRAKGNIKGRLQAFYLQICLVTNLLFHLKKGDFVCSYINKNNYLRRLIIVLTHFKKGFFISELCELPFGTGEETGEAKKGREYELTRLFPHYDGIIAISETLKELAEQHCNSHCVITKVPILVDFDNYNLPDKTAEADYPYIFHSGTLYEQKDGILGMIEAFGIAQKELAIPVHFILTGRKESSPHRKEIDALIEKYQMADRIHFVGYLQHYELKERLSMASLVIINKYPTQQNVFCFSTKLGEYTAAGKPIIITKVGEAMNWLTANKDCLMVEPNNKEQLVESIKNVFEHPEVAKSIGDEARITCRHSFVYGAYASVLNSMLTSIAK